VTAGRTVRGVSDDTTLDEIKTFAAALSPWAHLATVGSDGAPDVVPVHPGWEGATLWVMAGASSVKARNVSVNPAVALHWQVTEKGDGVEVWGTASVHADLDTKRRLWHVVFDYDLGAFAPGGPEHSPEIGFIAVRPTRALVLYEYGASGAKRWQASDTAS
jgi:general stress protein 26